MKRNGSGWEGERETGFRHGQRLRQDSERYKIKKRKRPKRSALRPRSEL